MKYFKVPYKTLCFRAENTINAGEDSLFAGWNNIFVLYPVKARIDISSCNESTTRWRTRLSNLGVSTHATY